MVVFQNHVDIPKIEPILENVKFPIAAGALSQHPNGGPGDDQSR
jgi:hypothetical protein